MTESACPNVRSRGNWSMASSRRGTPLVFPCIQLETSLTDWWQRDTSTIPPLSPLPPSPPSPLRSPHLHLHPHNTTQYKTTQHNHTHTRQDIITARTTFADAGTRQDATPQRARPQLTNRGVRFVTRSRVAAVRTDDEGDSRGSRRRQSSSRRSIASLKQSTVSGSGRSQYNFSSLRWSAVSLRS